MAKITWAGADLYMTDSIVVDYESGARRFYNIHEIPKTVWEWFKENRPKELKAIEIKKDPFGMVACMDSVEMYVETFGKNPIQMLEEYEQRAKEDVFFNRTMIEAVKQYIEEHELDGLTAEEFDDRAIRKEREQLISELMEDAKAILGEVLESLDEDKTVVIYADGSVNAPEVARYDSVVDIPDSLKGEKVHHYAQDINFYHVYMEQMPTEYEDEGVTVEPNNGSGYAHVGSMYDAISMRWNMAKAGAPTEGAHEFWQIRKLPQEPTANAVVLRQVGTFSEAVEALKEIKREHDANLVDVCLLSKEIRDRDPEALTDMGCICDYNGSTYVEDAFCEIADSETSIYYSDIISYISEHVEEVSDIINEMGWDSVGADLYKAGQYTEYTAINRWLWENSADIYRVYALNYIRSTYGEKIERTAWERFDSELEQYGEFNKLGEIEQLVDMTVGEEDELTA